MAYHEKRACACLSCRFLRSRQLPHRVLLAPELPPGSVAPVAPGVAVDEAGGVAVVPLVLPAPGVVTPGVAVLGTVAGVPVLGVVAGVAVVVPLAPGGPASVCPGACAGGMRVLLDESVGRAGFGPVGGATVSPGWCGAVPGGVISLWSTAFGPNGLLESIPLCASVGPAQPVHAGWSSAACGSASLTSAVVVRSSACASFTRTGCMNSMSNLLRANGCYLRS
jgi:hypothetical protein